MTKEELFEWAEHHMAAFPSWKRCFQVKEESLRGAVIGRMLRDFAGLSLVDAKAATDQLYDVEAVHQPKIDRHVWEVSRRARMMAIERSHISSSDGSGRCPWCRDTGIVFFFLGSAHPKLRVVNRDDGSSKPLREFAAEQADRFRVDPSEYFKRITATNCRCGTNRDRSSLTDVDFRSMVREWGPVHWRKPARTGEVVEVGDIGRRKFEHLSDDEQERVLKGQLAEKEF